MIDGQSSQRYVPAAPPSGLAFTACQVQHARATVELTRHPCQLAAHFLPCARPPDRQFGRSQHYHRAFVTTRARAPRQAVPPHSAHARRVRDAHTTQREPPKDSGPHSFGGPHPLPALLATFFDGLTYPEGTPPCLSTGSRGSY